MADVEQKLSNVEHQLETAKVEVTKPFAQEQELAEKLERLAELNALLNMDEKGDNALDMEMMSRRTKTESRAHRHRRASRTGQKIYRRWLMNR